jgi:NADH-quinone oxidoreductase subunit H
VVWELLLLLTSTLIFPGLLFTISLALFTQYIVRKLAARFQSRMGPSYVGPFGVLQPFYDFWKLLRVKEVVKTRFSMIRAAEIFLILGIAFPSAALIFLPISPFRVNCEFDVLIFFYMASVMPLIAVTMASLAMPGPYTSMGVSRLLSMATLAEPAFFASIVIPVYLATRSGEVLFMSLNGYVKVPTAWGSIPTAIIMILCFIAFIVSLQAKAMYQPFNIPEAEQEIIAGFETEFSGPLLALMRLLHDVDLAVSILLGVYVFFGGPLPFRHLSIGGILLLALKYVVLVVIVTLVRSVMGRYRIDQALVQLFKYSLVPALVAVILTLLL